jgi:hypothetical protein
VPRVVRQLGVLFAFPLDANHQSAGVMRWQAWIHAFCVESQALVPMSKMDVPQTCVTLRCPRGHDVVRNTGDKEHDTSRKCNLLVQNFQFSLVDRSSSYYFGYLRRLVLQFQQGTLCIWPPQTTPNNIACTHFHIRFYNENFKFPCLHVLSGWGASIPLDPTSPNCKHETGSTTRRTYRR